VEFLEVAKSDSKWQNYELLLLKRRCQPLAMEGEKRGVVAMAWQRLAAKNCLSATNIQSKHIIAIIISMIKCVFF
jgi:hypothetical protein